MEQLFAKFHTFLRIASSIGVLLDVLAILTQEYRSSEETRVRRIELFSFFCVLRICRHVCLPHLCARVVFSRVNVFLYQVLVVDAPNSRPRGMRLGRGAFHPQIFLRRS